MTKPAIPNPTRMVKHRTPARPRNLPMTISNLVADKESKEFMDPRSISPIIVAYASMSAMMGTKKVTRLAIPEMVRPRFCHPLLPSEPK
jgi:hypothetical protein